MYTENAAAVQSAQFRNTNKTNNINKPKNKANMIFSLITLFACNQWTGNLLVRWINAEFNCRAGRCFTNTYDPATAGTIIAALYYCNKRRTNTYLLVLNVPQNLRKFKR
jgi:hypothetical protein